MGSELVHFDIAAEDPDKLAKFYTDVLGWTIDAPDPQYEGYRLIKTSDKEEAVGGGMYKKMMPDQGVLNYYLVDSIEDTGAKVRDNGGQIVIEKMAVQKMGYMAVCLDPDGNTFGLWVDDPNAE